MRLSSWNCKRRWVCDDLSILAFQCQSDLRKPELVSRQMMTANSGKSYYIEAYCEPNTAHNGIYRRDDGIPSCHTVTLFQGTVIE